MKSKTYLYLAILAVLLIAAYFLTTDRGEKTTSYKLSDKKLFEIDSAKVDKLEVTTSNGTVVLSKSTGEWRVDSPYQYRTVSAQIESMVSSLKNLSLESLVSSNPEKKDTYGFNAVGQTEVTIYESGTQKGKFLIGNSAPSGSAYVKKIDSDDIYLAKDFERANFVKSEINDWRDKNIVSIPKEAINAVEFISATETFTAKKDSAGSFYVGADSAKALDGVLNLLNKFDTNGFKDTTLAAETVFDQKIIIDWGNKTQLNFLKIQDQPKYLLQVSDDKQIYELEEGYAKNILKTRKDITGK